MVEYLRRNTVLYIIDIVFILINLPFALSGSVFNIFVIGFLMGVMVDQMLGGYKRR
jgi:hypothetical protein